MLGLKYNWNSAVISGPISTTIIDIFTFAVYLGITTLIFVPLATLPIFS
jgi:Mg/Co/Ni transporter MgtE